PKIIIAHVVGSGTTLISRPQPATVLTSPPDMSAKNNVHVPSALVPLKLPNSTDGLSVSTTVAGFTFRPSGVHVPVRVPPLGFCVSRYRWMSPFAAASSSVMLYPASPYPNASLPVLPDRFNSTANPLECTRYPYKSPL